MAMGDVPAGFHGEPYCIWLDRFWRPLILLGVSAFWSLVALRLIADL